jgi:hypothetical protein
MEKCKGCEMNREDSEKDKEKEGIKELKKRSENVLVLETGSSHKNEECQYNGQEFCLLLRSYAA